MKTIESLLGPNWRTTLTGWGSAFAGLLAALAAAPYQLGEVATIIPPQWKEKLFAGAAIAAFLLRCWNSSTQKDRNVSGNGTIFEPYKVNDGVIKSRSIPPEVSGGISGGIIGK